MNYSRRALTVFFLILLAIALKAQVPTRVPLGQQIKKLEEKPLSEIITDLKYIPLETKPECLLGQSIKQIEIYNERLFVCDYNHVYIFDLNGKFLNKFVKHGRGPGECLNEGFPNFLLDQKDKRFSILDLMSKRMLTYGFDGSFLFENKLNFMPGPSAWVNGNIIAVFNMGFTYEKQPWTDLYFLDTNGKTVKKNRFDYDKNNKYAFTVFPALFYQFDGETRYKNPHQNFIYEITNDNSLVPVYYLDYGVYESKSGVDEFEFSVNKKNEVTYRANPKSSEKIGILRIDETKDFLLITYVHQTGKHLGVYDKKVGRFYRVFDGSYGSYGFTDDLMSGIPFFPNYITGNYIISYVNAVSLIESSKNLGKDNDLKEIVSKIKEEDNPILIIGKIKE
jgi:hypothetical protein